MFVGGISWGSDLGVAVGATSHLALWRQGSAFLCPWAGNYTYVASGSKCLSVLCLLLLLEVQEAAAETGFCF